MADSYEINAIQTYAARPTSVTWLAVGVLIMGGINLMRSVLSLQRWDFLTSLGGVPPLYTAATGAVAAAVLIPTGLGLWFGWRWALWVVQGAVPLYLVYFWLDRLVLYRPFGADGQDPALPFFAGATAFILLYLFLVVNRKMTRSYFGVLHE